MCWKLPPTTLPTGTVTLPPKMMADTIMQAEELQVDGKFSRDRYTSLLRQQNKSEGQFEHELRGNLAGFHSIRVNAQWRLIFRWDGERGEATDVHLDDHRYR